MKPLVWLDLFCGMRGASKPAADRGWRVIGIDIEERFKPDVVADLRYGVPLRTFRLDVFWASIPCDGYARCILPWKTAKPEDASTELAEVTRREIVRFAPAAWIIECSSLSRKFLTPIFGPVRATIGTSHAFWSNFPLLIGQTLPFKARMGPRSDRAALRARLDPSIGEAICLAVERRAEERQQA